MDNRSTKGESSSAKADESNESNLQFDMTQLRIERAINEGPNSCVHQGLYKGIPVAIKRIQRERGTNVSAVQKVKFQREVRLLSTVEHGNIVKYIGATMDPALTIVTEFMGGGSLKQHLQNIRPSTLNLEDALAFALGISRAMEHLHANGIIHRGLKPSNIFLTEDKKTVKIGDFGLCKQKAEDELCGEVGSQPWLGPELFNIPAAVCRMVKRELPDELITRWKPKYDHKVDVFSFSLLLWEMITNKPPFNDREDFMIGLNIARFNLRPNLDAIPFEINILLNICWATDPKERPEFELISQILESMLSRISPSDTSLVGKIQKCLCFCVGE